MLRRNLIVLIVAGCLYAPAASASGGEDWLRHALDAACRHPTADGETLAAAMPGTRLAGGELLRAAGLPIGWRRDFDLPGNARLRIERIQPGGRLRRLSAEYHEAGTDGGPRPRIAAIANGACEVVAARRLVYGDEVAASGIEHLDAAFEPTGIVEPLDPPVPTGTDPGGVTVALVDAGVNYLLPDVATRLARDASGAAIGYDFWDMDERPFDANPAGSPFFPQRHGTRTATLLLREAPNVRLVPYRYPRPDMQRLANLVRHADEHGAAIVNLSLGSNRREDWLAFADAAREVPDILFVVSAGNDGRDIDASPVYPAALDLDNLITVTSSEPNGALARGSNSGAVSVDLLVPAEGVPVTGFDGRETLAYGSSYAAVRVSALAARLLARHPDWKAAELKRAILERTLPPHPGSTGTVAEGFLPRPARADRIDPVVIDDAVRVTGRRVIDPRDGIDQTGPVLSGAATAPLELPLTFAVFESTDWQAGAIDEYARQAASILATCGIRVPSIDVLHLDGGDQYRYFRDDTATGMLARVDVPRPAVFFLRHTLQDVAFEAEAIGHGNSAGREALTNTVWIIEDARDPGIIIAHELVHLLVDNGSHVDEPGNLMRADTSPTNTHLSPAQCEEIVHKGRGSGLLVTAAR